MAFESQIAEALPGEVALRSFSEAGAAESASVALLAMGIPSRVEIDGSRVLLLVPVPAAFRAKSILDSLDAEAAEAGRVDAAPELPPASLLGWAVAFTLVGFQLVTGPRNPASRWFESGAADVARIAAGEWWRAVTALTLHADLGHVFGNAVAAVILLGALGQRLGIGTAAWAALLSGTAGNLAAAWLYRPGHSSVGASTAIFGALGALTALALVRPVPVRQRLLALGAGLALLGFTGTGPGSDLGAHALGFAAGVLVGLLAGALRLDRGRPSSWRQPLAAAGAFAATLACWSAALHAP